MTGDLLDWLLLGLAAFVASLLAAITGFGSAAMLLPLLAAICGVREAIPTLTVAQLLGNFGRAWFNRRDLNWPVVSWFSLGSVPAALAGGVLFASISAPALTRLLGAFLLVIVAYRRLKRAKSEQMSLRAFAPLGAVSSFISALLGSVGPLLAPFFLAYGLTKASYVGTIALSAVVMHVAKLVAYGAASVLTPTALILGLILGMVMLPGSWVGKKLVDRVSERAFVIVVEVALVTSALCFLLAP